MVTAGWVVAFIVMLYLLQGCAGAELRQPRYVPLPNGMFMDTDCEDDWNPFRDACVVRPA